MMIDKVHGLQATSMSLNERFTMLAGAPDPVVVRPRRRPNVNYFNYNQNQNLDNYVNQLVRRLKMEAKRQAIKQRLGALRRFGSEGSLPGLRRSNSFGNLSQNSFRSRGVWRAKGNLSRAASFENVSQAWRNFRGRGGGARGLRGRFRGRGRRGAGGAGARSSPGRGRGGGARARGRGRGGMLRNQQQKPVPSKEELDEQLDRYMASTRSALDKEIDTYMKNAMELE